MQLSKQGMYDVLAAGGVTGELSRIMAGGSHAESGWNTEATGDIRADGYVCSFSLFQINRCGGLGVGYSEAELRDPAVQVAIMAPVYRAQYDRYRADGWDGVELATRVCLASERPFGWLDPDGPAAQGYRRGYAAAAPDEATEPPGTHYNPDTPPEYQGQDWTCSVRTATWLANSLGFGWDAGDVQDRMVAAGLVSHGLGLLDGTGAALHGWLVDETGNFGVGQVPVTWEWLQEFAGESAIGMGSGTLYHWLAVRRANDDGTLQLMNPAPGYRGVGEGMDRATFERWAPWNAFSLIPHGIDGGDDSMTESQRVIVQDEILRNIDKALGFKLPKAAREALEFGARPACETLIRGEG